MIESHWFALVVGASVLTLGWLYIRENVALTTLLASALWFYAAYSGGDLRRITESGSEVAVGAPELQYVALALALLSLLARVLYWFGEYPPNEQVAAEGSPSAEPAD